MKFAKLSEYLAKLEKTTLRNEMTAVIAELFKKASVAEIDKICYLSLGRLGPKFSAVQFNLAVKMMIKALALAFEISEGEVSKFFKKFGDLGHVAFELKRKTQNAKRKTTTKNLKLSVSEIYSRLHEIAGEGGEGSVERKIGKMAKLLQELDPLSVKYVVRIPLARLRLGFSDMTILDALSWMMAGDKSKRSQIEAAYNVRADVGQIARKLKVKSQKLKVEIKNSKLRAKKLRDYLYSFKPALGTPIVPALCQRLPNAEEMIEKMCRRKVGHPRSDRRSRTGSKVAVEPKYDGQRLQLHRDKSEVNIFTRNLDNVRHMFPDIVEALGRVVKAKRVILDGEAVGYEPKTGKLLPFQETIKRKRKHLVVEKAREIPLKFFCFDILYKDGRDLLRAPFKERRRVLEKTLKKGDKTVVLSPQIVTDDPRVIRRFHEEQIKKGLEGAVLKRWEAAYDPGRRGYTWVKFKSEKKGKRGGGLADTLDCLVLGFNRGRGRRAAFGIGAFLVGVRKKLKVKSQKLKIDGFVTVSKVGTGLTDEQWKKLKVKSEKLKVKEKPKEYQVDKNLYPDVWCSPGIVVEIEADNITKSPIHTAGYALRFPRLIRFRDDKDPEQATTVGELKRLYEMQR